MMTTIYAALILMLAMAPPAEAACAWVLWSKLSTTVAGTQKTFRQWAVLDTFESKAKCEAYAQAIYATDEARAAIAAGRLELGPMSAKEIRPDGLVVNTVFFCLPDTVDPRGPKGSGR
jgi:hypothetical protein